MNRILFSLVLLALGILWLAAGVFCITTIGAGSPWIVGLPLIGGGAMFVFYSVTKAGWM